MTCNVLAKPGWILERLARELTVLPGVDYNAGGWPLQVPSVHDVLYFLPASDIRHMTAPRRDSQRAIGFFTHGLERVEIYGDRFDVCLAMNERMAGWLRARGARDVQVLRPGTESPRRPMTFGVCGRVHGKGRKGAFLVEQAVAAGYDFRACTDGRSRGEAPCPVTHSIVHRSAFYGSIDYLVVTSVDEGGPMPVLEAIAHGVPVIAPDVGWCWEFPVIRYDVSSWESLRGVLHRLTHPPTWADWVEGHRAVFAALARRGVAA